MIISAYKAPGEWRDTLIRTACSVRHLQPVQYSHVEIRQSLSNGISISASKRDGNIVRKTTINYKPGHWDHFVIDRYDIWNRAHNFLEIPYDTRGAILCVTPFAKASIDTVFCSEMIALLCEWTDAHTYDPHMVTSRLLNEGAIKIIG